MRLLDIFKPREKPLQESMLARSRCVALKYDRQCNIARSMLEDVFNFAPNEDEALKLLLDALSSRQTSDQNYDTAAYLRNYATKQRGTNEIQNQSPL